MQLYPIHRQVLLLGYFLHASFSLKNGEEDAKARKESLTAFMLLTGKCAAVCINSEQPTFTCQ